MELSFTGTSSSANAQGNGSWLTSCPWQRQELHRLHEEVVLLPYAPIPGKP